MNWQKSASRSCCLSLSVRTRQKVWCAGTYIIGCEQVFSVDNNVVITRMEDEGGAEWSKPVKLTEARCPS